MEKITLSEGGWPDRSGRHPNPYDCISRLTDVRRAAESVCRTARTAECIPPQSGSMVDLMRSVAALRTALAGTREGYHG